MKRIMTTKLKQALMVAWMISHYDLQAQTTPHPVRINQEGYYTKGPKLAVVVDTAVAGDFCLVDVQRHDTVYRGKLGRLRASANSSLQTRLADFSDWTKAGRYQLVIHGLEPSYAFRIGGQVHHASAVALLKGFYYQRVSCLWNRPMQAPGTGLRGIPIPQYWYILRRPAQHALPVL